MSRSSSGNSISNRHLNEIALVSHTFCVLLAYFLLCQTVPLAILTLIYIAKEKSTEDGEDLKAQTQSVAGPISWLLAGEENVRSDCSAEVSHHKA